MEHVIAIIKKLFLDISAALDLSTDLLLIIGLGALLLLLIILMVARKKPRRQKIHKDSDSGFLEVGPEPVIVYGRGRKQEEPQPEPEPELEPEALPQFDLTPEPEPESVPQFDLTPKPEPESVPQFDLTPEPEPESLPQLDLTPEPLGQLLDQPDFPPEPEPQPLSPLKPEPLDLSSPPQAPESSPFQRFMNADFAQEAATAFKPALAQDPLPLLESDFASEILLLFSKQGFTIEKVAYHGTDGADFIVAAKGIRAYVQVKDWKKKATPRTVQEARYYSNTNGCHKTILIPVAGYTSAANREAAQRAVFLWNAKTLKKVRNGELSLEEWIAASSF